MNEDNEDDGVIYIDSNEENDINLFQLDEYNVDESDMEWKMKYVYYFNILKNSQRNNIFLYISCNNYNKSKIIVNKRK